MIHSINHASNNLGERLLQQMESAGSRPTRARSAVLQALTSRADGFTIEELCNDVRPIGRATVYRTVRLLLNEGLICKLAMRDTSPRYSLSRPGHHHHTVCARCGTVDDFPECDIDDLIERIRSAVSGEVLGHRLEVYILCAECKQASAAPVASKLSASDSSGKH